MGADLALARPRVLTYTLSLNPSSIKLLNRVLDHVAVTREGRLTVWSAYLP